MGKAKFLNFLSFCFTGLITLTILSTLFLFWGLTTEFYETPKFLVLVASLGLMVLLLGVKFLVLGRVTIGRTNLDLVWLGFLILIILSTIFSSSRGDSIYGNLPRLQGGLLGYLGVVLLYFATTSSLVDLSDQARFKFTQTLTGLLFFSGVVLSILSLLYYFGLFILPFKMTAGFNFTPTGSSFNTNALLVLLIPFSVFSLLRNDKNDVLLSQQKQILPANGKTANKYALRMILSVILSLFVATLILTGNLPIYIAALLALLLGIVFTPGASLKRNVIFLFLPLLTFIVLTVVSYVKLPPPLSFVYNQAQNFPRELQLPADISWKVAASSFRDYPFLGSGPASFLNDFTVYKPIEFNSSQLWNIRFDTAFNEYFQYLATLGPFGLIILLILTVLVLTTGFKVLNDPNQTNHNLSLAAAAVLVFVLLALHFATLPLMILAVLFVALFVSSQQDLNQDLSFGIAATKKGSQVHLSFDVLPLVLAIIFLVFVSLAYYYVGQFALADYYHRQGLLAAGQNQGLPAYQNLQKAESINPSIDSYHTDMANINFALANVLVAQKGPANSSPSGSLTDTDKQNIQILLGQSINEGKASVALNPNSANNWEVLASVYRGIAGVAQNALSLALDGYGHAVQRDPLNPLLRLNIGGIYYSVKDYDSAVRFFSDVVTLKPDYANGYYNLGIALREKGNLQTAQAALEKTMSLLDPNSQDYKTAAQVLSDIKDRLASQSASQPSTQAENGNSIKNAGNSTSALDNKNLPKVLNLPQPENIATPSAVKPTPSQ